MTGKLKVTIGRKGCISCGKCWNSCPDFFEKNPEDVCGQVIEKYRIKNNPFEGEAPAGIGKMVKRAADLCPVWIIQIMVKN